MAIRGKQIGWSQESNLLWQILQGVSNLTKQFSVKCAGHVPNTTNSGTVPPRQIGWSNESELLWEISRELNRTIAVAGTCGNPYLYTMQTFTDFDTPGYPVGVFNLDGTYVGIANDQSEYVTLWNSDPVNSAVTTISAGSTPTTFSSPDDIGDSKLRGMRFWQVDVRGWANLAVAPEDKILVDTTIYNGSSFFREFRQSSFYGRAASYFYAKIYNPLPNPTPWIGYSRQANINVGATQKVVTVFHNDTTYFAGFCSNAAMSQGSGLSDQISPTYKDSEIKNVRGNFPIATEYILIGCNGIVTDNHYPANINMSELTNVLFIQTGFGDQVSTAYFTAGVKPAAEYNFNIWHTSLPNKSKLLALNSNLYRVNTSTTSFDGTGVSFGDFPNIKQISLQTMQKPFTVNAATFPKINNFLDMIYGNQFGSQGWTAAEIDAIYNMLGTALVGIVPEGWAWLRVQYWNTNATAASLTARTYLASQGWTIQ
jgi:hypothetical protein